MSVSQHSVNISGNVSISGDVSISECVSISDNVSMSGDVSISDCVSISGSVSTTVDVNISDSASISGIVSMSGDVSIPDCLASTVWLRWMMKWQGLERRRLLPNPASVRNAQLRLTEENLENLGLFVVLIQIRIKHLTSWRLNSYFFGRMG